MREIIAFNKHRASETFCISISFGKFDLSRVLVSYEMCRVVDYVSFQLLPV